MELHALFRFGVNKPLIEYNVVEITDHSIKNIRRDNLNLLKTKSVLITALVQEINGQTILRKLDVIHDIAEVLHEQFKLGGGGGSSDCPNWAQGRKPIFTIKRNLKMDVIVKKLH